MVFIPVWQIRAVELNEDERRVLAVQGIYRWGFDTPVPGVPLAGVQVEAGPDGERLLVLYVGLARDSLMNRVRGMHLLGNEQCSTLRHSLRALMCEQELVFSEDQLNEWLDRHAWVEPIPHPDPGAAEQLLLDDGDRYPLNAQHAPKWLGSLRRQWRLRWCIAETLSGVPDPNLELVRRRAGDAEEVVLTDCPGRVVLWVRPQGRRVEVGLAYDGISGGRYWSSVVEFPPSNRRSPQSLRQHFRQSICRYRERTTALAEEAYTAVILFLG